MLRGNVEDRFLLCMNFQCVSLALNASAVMRGCEKMVSKVLISIKSFATQLSVLPGLFEFVTNMIFISIFWTVKAIILCMFIKKGVMEKIWSYQGLKILNSLPEIHPLLYCSISYLQLIKSTCVYWIMAPSSSGIVHTGKGDVYAHIREIFIHIWVRV